MGGGVVQAHGSLRLHRHIVSQGLHTNPGSLSLHLCLDSGVSYILCNISPLDGTAQYFGLYTLQIPTYPIKISALGGTK